MTASRAFTPSASRGAVGSRGGRRPTLASYDFQHLAITFLRALNIPARYVTGYLGDVGVPPAPTPMNFSAWAEAYVGDAWRPIDARHNQPHIGRVLMARGRDAVDVALSTSLGNTSLTDFSVWTLGGGNDAST